MTKYPEKVLELAKRFVNAGVDYSFSEVETRALTPFFTNLDRKISFMQALPPNVDASLLAMFSRIKNPRGLRGVFVDKFLPQFLAGLLPEAAKNFGGDEVRFLQENRITNLDLFAAYSQEAAYLLQQFSVCAGNFVVFLANLSAAKNSRKFLSLWIDNFSHKSIGRMANLRLCCEGVSLLAAKSLEWNRPGSGYIELSTRYVDMSGKDTYPIELELEAGWNVDPKPIVESRDFLFHLYRSLAGEKFDGILPNQMREKYGGLFADDLKSLQAGIVGETCDILGNLLPASTLTSVGINVSGEAFPQLLKHLILDDTPENLALVEAILEESKKVGGNQFATHYEPTEWEEKIGWQYPATSHFRSMANAGRPSIEFCWDRTKFQFSFSNLGCVNVVDFDPQSIRCKIARLSTVKRGEFDKLPRDFEDFTLPFAGVMSFRSWRDLHRQGFCTHSRTYLTPRLGFYNYDKLFARKDTPYPAFLFDSFDAAHKNDWDVYNSLREKKVPAVLKQYPMALGNNVGFKTTANLRQWEFCIWQRTKPSVNHEVRQIFVDIESKLRRLVFGWHLISRANMTPAYVFARGEKVIPLNKK